MNRSIFCEIKYMNGLFFSKVRYMIGVGFKILARTVNERCGLHFYLIPQNRSQQRERTESLVVCAEHIVVLQVQI